MSSSAFSLSLTIPVEGFRVAEGEPDCGGIPGFYDLLAARADPSDDNHADAVTWLEEYDPDTLDELPIKYALGRIAARRNAARARLAKQAKA